MSINKLDFPTLAEQKRQMQLFWSQSEDFYGTKPPTLYHDMTGLIWLGLHREKRRMWFVWCWDIRSVLLKELYALEGIHYRLSWKAPLSQNRWGFMKSDLRWRCFKLIKRATNYRSNVCDCCFWSGILCYSAETLKHHDKKAHIANA